MVARVKRSHLDAPTGQAQHYACRRSAALASPVPGCASSGVHRQQRNPARVVAAAEAFPIGCFRMGRAAIGTLARTGRRVNP